MDLLIAATAHAHAAGLYTRNVDDLRGLEDLVDIIAVCNGNGTYAQAARPSGPTGSGKS
jgi:hypothetical protein